MRDQRVNHWAEKPVVAADVDLVSAIEQVEDVVAAFMAKWFKVERFPWSVNLRVASLVSLQISTAELYSFPRHLCANPDDRYHTNES